MGKKLAIVGAGVSGLAAAFSLRETGLDVTVFEKSRGVSGRAASRTRNGARFDHGANYFKFGGEVVEELILNQLPTADLERIEGYVWTFDSAGVLSPGDPVLDAETKWTYRTGISTLGKLLAEASGAKVRIGRIMQADSTWELFSEGGEFLGVFDAILVTVPRAPELGNTRAKPTPWRNRANPDRGSRSSEVPSSVFGDPGPGRRDRAPGRFLCPLEFGPET